MKVCFLLVGIAVSVVLAATGDAPDARMFKSRGTRSERDVDDITDVSFYVSLPGRRFLIPRLNIAASEQDFERLRIALAHLRNAKIGEIDLPIEAGFPGLFRSCLEDGYVLNVGIVIIRNRDQLRFAVDSTNATRLVFYDHYCLEFILGATSCERQVDLAIQQKTNANFFKVLVADRYLRVLAGGIQHACFPGKGCDSDFRHDDCDKHCRNHTFLIGACEKIYDDETTFGGFTASHFCCCFGIAGSPMAILPISNPSPCA